MSHSDAKAVLDHIKAYREQRREDDLRATASAHGMLVEKHTEPGFGTYRLVSIRTGEVVEIASCGGYGLTLDDVARYFRRPGRKALPYPIPGLGRATQR